MARVTLELENIQGKVLKRLEELKGRPLKKSELKKYNSAYLTISDIAVCHNGESNTSEIQTNRGKTDDAVEHEYKNAFIEKGFDRKIRSRSKEGCIVFFCDPISYVAKDFRDGVIKGVVDVNDPDFEKLFIQMGISKETLDSWASNSKKKDKILSKVARFLRDDLSKNSAEIDGAKMSSSASELMYKLRQLDYDKAVKPSLRKLNDLLPNAIHKLIDIYSQLLLNPNSSNLSLSDDQNFYRKKFSDTISNYPESVNEIYEDIVEQGINRNVKNEITEIISRQTYFWKRPFNNYQEKKI